MFRRRAPDTVVTIACWSTVVGLLWNLRGADPDLFARAAVGRAVELTGWVLARDPFSFQSRPSQWIDHEWLSGVVFYRLAALGGDEALWWWKWGICGLFISAVRSATADPSGRTQPIPLFIGIAGSLYVWISTLRAQIFTYLFLAIYLLFIKKSGRLRLVFFPVIMLVWVNLHGGWILGCFILALYTFFRLAEVGRAVAPLLASTLATFLATLMNPWGTELWTFLRRALWMSRPGILEWQRVPFMSPVGMLMLLVIAWVFGQWALSGVRNDGNAKFRVTALIFSAVLGFIHLRLAGAFFLVAAILFSDELAEPPRVLRNILNWSGRAALVLGCGLFLNRVSSGFSGLDYGFYPVGACEFLGQSGYGGKLLVPFNSGSFALWRLFPRFRIAVDGRYEEVYDQTVLNEVRCAFTPSCPSRDSALGAMEPDCILSPRKLAETFPVVYRPVYSDPLFTVLCQGAPQKEIAEDSRGMWESGFVLSDLR